MKLIKINHAAFGGVQLVQIDDLFYRCVIVWSCNSCEGMTNVEKKVDISYLLDSCYLIMRLYIFRGFRAKGPINT